MTYFGDVYSLVAADGASITLPDGAQAFLTAGGFGAPPTELLSRQGYQQHGATEIGYALRERAITVVYHRDPADTRQAYWDHRAELLDLLRPNRGGPLTLTLTMPEGERRSIHVRANPGPALDVPEDENNWSLEEAIEFLALDPIWYDPDAVVLAAASTVTNTNLVFPITFPITFGDVNTVLATPVIAYDGTWESITTITITGPYTWALLYNAAGTLIVLAVPVTAGHSRIITLNPEQFSIVDETGADKFNELGPQSDLVGFNLKPDPEQAGGTDQIHGIFYGGTGATTLQVSYLRRFFAL